MTDYDLRQQCNVLWIPRIPAQGGVEGGEKRHFETVTEGIRFVMTGIPENVRVSAWITTDTGSIQFDEIEKLYGQLPADDD